MMRCRSLRQMLERRAESSKIARNHTLSGLCVFSSSVPDVSLLVPALRALERGALAEGPHARLAAMGAGWLAAPSSIQ
jgi:hypothetical protein